MPMPSSRYELLLGRHRTGFVPLLEDVVRERVPEKLDLGHGYFLNRAIRRSAL